jgi:ribosome biogenesis protein YTM1
MTASYDGRVRAFNYSQRLTSSSAVHPAPITSFCLVPSTDSDLGTYTLATASHDLTAKLLRFSLHSDSSQTVVPLATLHLHTAPVSSVSSDPSGSHLLTSSWDGTIGLWDTVIPSSDEVPLNQVEMEDRRKRRKIADEPQRPKRKAPVSVLKSHTARVSKTIFGGERGSVKTAHSCGFDSTVRTWDLEKGICVSTIVRNGCISLLSYLIFKQNASEKPMLDLTLATNLHTALVASTDRTISMYDLRNPTTALNVAVTVLPHAATPSCIAHTASQHQFVSGAYDGVVRLWDLRSTKSAMTSFKVWDGCKKILAVDWAGGVVGVGGEGGMEIWHMGDHDRATTS